MRISRRAAMAATSALVVPVSAGAADAPLRADALRTPDDQFASLPGFAFAPNYVVIDGYRVHYVDVGSRSAAPVLMLHGEPTWAFLYRKMIPPVAAAGSRVIAPDLIGFGRSDKPKSQATHTYAFHVAVITRLIDQLNLENATLVCQDWGSLIGLRVVAERPERFARIVVGNGALPTGDGDLGLAFAHWKRMVEGFQKAGDMQIGSAVMSQYTPEVQAAYDAPFPDASYKAGPLALPLLVPATPDDPASAANRHAWKVLEAWTKPFLTSYSDGDPITRGSEVAFQLRVPGARGRRHAMIEGAGHFLQEDKGEIFAQVVNEFIAGRR